MLAVPPPTVQPTGVLVSLAPEGAPIPWLVAAVALGGFASVVYNINQVSLRQAIVPLRLQGRMNASMRFLVWGTLPLGSLTGGILATLIEVRVAVAVGVGVWVAVAVAVAVAVGVGVGLGDGLGDGLGGALGFGSVGPVVGDPKDHSTRDILADIARRNQPA